jgi:hypothetical protein
MRCQMLLLWLRKMPRLLFRQLPRQLLRKYVLFLSVYNNYFVPTNVIPFVNQQDAPSSPVVRVLEATEHFLATFGPYIGTGVGIGAGLALYIYAPPIAAMVTRALFPMAYNFLMGPPSSWWEYAFIYVPLREHAVAWAFNNASPLAMMAVPILGFVGHKVAAVSSYLVGRIAKGVRKLF